MPSFADSSLQIREALKSCLTGNDDFVELRFHAKTSRSVTVEKGRVEKAAKRLGIPRSSLYQKIKKHQIIPPSKV